MQPAGDGYLRIVTGSVLDGTRRSALAHIVTWEAANGPVPAGQILDHICCDPAWCPGGACRHRSCNDETHLMLSTVGANVLRGSGLSARAARATHCPQGHPYEGPNLYLRRRPNGHKQRECRACIYQRDVARGRFKARQLL